MSSNSGDAVEVESTNETGRGGVSLRDTHGDGSELFPNATTGKAFVDQQEDGNGQLDPLPC